MSNRQDNNFGDIWTHGQGQPDDNDGLRECDQDQMDCSAYVNGMCGVDECIYEEGRSR